jgi:signal transduction histidine kinase/ActR/RegA family two-component response regulator
MKVRSQLILLLACVLLSIEGITFLLKKFIIQDTRIILQDKLSQTKKTFVPGIFSLNEADIREYANDYSGWDQMVNFISQHRDSAWAKRELDLPLGNHKVDYIWVLDGKAREYYYSSTNPKLQVAGLDIPTTHLSGSLILKNTSSFFIIHNSSVVQVFTAPIQPTADVTRQTTPLGYLLLGRIIDSNYMARLQGISPEIQVSFVNNKNAYTDNADPKTGDLQFSIPLKGFNGAILAAFNITRDFRAIEGYQSSLNRYLLLFLVLMIILGVVFYYLSKNLLLQPLSVFSGALQQNSPANLTYYNQKKNELGDLSRLITSFFAQNEKLAQQIEVREKREAELSKALDEKYTAQSEKVKVEQFLAQQQAMLKLSSSNPDGLLDEMLKETIALGAKTLNCQRVGIWYYNDDHSAITAKYIYHSVTNEYLQGDTAYEKDYPDYFKYLKKNILLVADDALNNPATAQFGTEYLIPFGITSMMDVPVRCSNRVIGMICFEHVGPKREWGINEQSFARSLADIITMRLTNDELKQTDRELKKSQVRFEETQELAQIGSWELNLFTYEVVWSKEMYRVFEVDPGENLIEAYRNRIHPDDLSVFDTAVKKLIEKDEVHSLECRIVSKNGGIKYILAIGEAIRSSKQAKVIGIRGTVQDITKQRQSAMAKSEFLSNMSHEIRTPINGVIGIANLLKEEELSEKQKEYVDTLNFSADHLSTIVSDILDFSKIESGHMTFEKISFNIEKNCRYIFDLFAQKAAEKNIAFHFKPAPSENYSLYGDYVRLNQVLSNLLSNAIKFTEKGSVDFSYTIRDENADKVIVSFSIKDTGIGILEEQQKNIFESFKQADKTIARQYGGTGLGLTISKKLVELQGGKISVNSVPEKGTEFIVQLSFDKHVYQEKAEIKITAAEKDLVKDLRGMKILVAEDNKVNAMVLTRFLSKWNIESKVAKDGVEAIGYLYNEDFDMVLMDIQMPNIDGIEATRIIRQSDKEGLKDLVIVAFTADASVDTHRQLLKIGFNHCMTKPFDPNVLYSFLKKNFKYQPAGA